MLWKHPVRTLVLLVIACSPLTICGAQSLDELLGTGSADLKKSRPETLALWNDLLNALDETDTTRAKPLVKQFNDVLDYTEPYQKTFTGIVLEIYGRQEAQGKPAPNEKQTKETKTDSATAPSDREKEIQGQIDDKKAEKQKQENDVKRYNSELASKENEIALDRASKEQGAKPSPVNFVPLIPGLPPIIPDAWKRENQRKERAASDKTARLQSEKVGIEKQRSDARQTLTRLDREIDSLSERKQQEHEGQIAEMDAKSRAEKADHERSAQRKGMQAAEFQKKVVSFINDLLNLPQYRPAIALATTYQKCLGNDTEIALVAQKARDSQAARNRAVEVAQTASKPVKDCIAEGRFWSAKAEIQKASDLISQRVTDPALLDFIKREFAKTVAEVDRLVQSAGKERDNIVLIAQRDPDQAIQDLEAFKKQHPDYPNYDSDKEKITAGRYEKQLAAIDEVIANDPIEGKAMIARLLIQYPDAASVFNSRITAMKRKILQGEEATIRQQMDEAQSYLTRYVQTNGGILSSAGVENLVRARSVQAGAIKQLDILLQEEMDNVTKSRLVGLLETQKAALAQMDGTLAAAQRNRVLLPAVGVGIVFLVVASVLLLWKRRKSGTRLENRPGTRLAEDLLSSPSSSEEV